MPLPFLTGFDFDAGNVGLCATTRRQILDDTRHSLSDLEERKARRFLVLQAAYELSDGNAQKEFRQQDVEDALGFSQEEVDALVLYLKNEGLLTLHSLGRVYKMTHAGVAEYKAAVNHPAAPTRHFPPVNVIDVERAGQSMVSHEPEAVPPVPVQPAPPAATPSRAESPTLPPRTGVSAQAQIATKAFDSAVIKALVREIRAANITLSRTDSDTLNSDLATVEAQLKRPQPRRLFIAESFGSARTIIGGAGEDLLAGKIALLLVEMAAWDF